MMIHRRQKQRSIKGRLEEVTVDASKMGELLCYSDVIYEEGGISSKGHRFSFFFAHDGHDYLIEDHYCPRPTCECHKVHVEFWERIELRGRSPRVDVIQQLMAVFSLDGKLDDIQFSKNDRPSAEELSRAWVKNCSYQLDEFRRRYRQVKAIGQRSIVPEPNATHVVDVGGTCLDSTLVAGLNTLLPDRWLAEHPKARLEINRATRLVGEVA